MKKHKRKVKVAKRRRRRRVLDIGVPGRKKHRGSLIVVSVYAVMTVRAREDD